MKLFIGGLLEFIRMIILAILFIFIAGQVLLFIYTKLGVNVHVFGWIGIIGLYLVFFIIYRNYLQFRGWYTGKERKRLSGRYTRLIGYISIILVLFPIVLQLFYG